MFNYIKLPSLSYRPLKQDAILKDVFTLDNSYII